MLTLIPFVISLFNNPFGRVAVAALGVLLSYNIAYYRGVWSVDVAGIKRAAADARDLTWQKKLDEQEKASQQAIDAAIAAGVSAIPSPDNSVDQLCRKSPSCRDKGSPQL